MTTTTPIDWTAAGTAAAHATRTSLGDEPVDLATARDVMEAHLFYEGGEYGPALRSLDMDARRAALASLALPANSDALSARLRAMGQGGGRSFALICDMLADMPEATAVLYADRVRDLLTVRQAAAVADLLAAGGGVGPVKVE